MAHSAAIVAKLGGSGTQSTAALNARTIVCTVFRPTSAPSVFQASILTQI